MRTLRAAEVLAVGTELLGGYRIDTNSQFLARRLGDLGIAVRARVVVGDDLDDLAARVATALAGNDVVITTGGLGPTDDDLTRQAVARVLGLTLEERPEIVDSIRARFSRRGWQMPEINRRQAFVPRGADVLTNARGTAPGLFITRPDGRLVILLPGPPRELEPMFDEQVIPRLAAQTVGRRIHRRTLLTTGRSESQVEEIAHPIYSSLSDDAVRVETTILATPGQIELHLAAAGEDASAIDRRLDDGVSRLSDALGAIVFSTDGRPLEAVVGDLLGRRQWYIAAAESCTGGLLLGRLTSVPGSSGWVAGGVVAYADEVKVRDLGVPAELLRAHGAVSEPVAAAMATGVRARFGVAVGIGITGIAGPGGGSDTKPVGMVVIALSVDGESTVRTLNFPGDREAIRRHSTSAALDLVRRALL